MEDEIDLRQQVGLLIRHWKLILGLALLGGIAGVIYGFTITGSYQAFALVTVSSPRFSLDLEGLTPSNNLPVRAYPELALSGDVISEVYTQVKDALPPTTNTVAKFASRLAADPTADASLLRLTVRDTDPDRAALIANTWATVFTARAGQLYGQDNANLIIYEQQANAALEALNTADNAFAAFQSINQTSVLTAQVTSKQEILGDNLARQYQIGLLLNDAHGLAARLEQLNDTAPAGLAEDLALLALTSRLYGGQMVAVAGQDHTSGVQVQMGSDQPLTGATVAAQRALAEDLIQALETRQAETDSAIAALGPELLELQGALAAAALQEVQLQRAQVLAGEHYLTVAQQLQAAQIAVQETGNVVQVASLALVPTTKVSPSRTIYIGTGLAAGMVLGALLALGSQFWPSAAKPAPSAAPPAAPPPTS